MEDKLVDLIDKIITMIEDDDFGAYKYLYNRFLFIDKEQNIDFQAKIGYNNYFFRDAVNKLTYIKVKKFLDNNTTLQQILIEEEDKKFYYSYVERNNYTSLAQLASIKGKETMVCINNEVVNKKWEDIIKYADNTFETLKFEPDSEEIVHFESFFDDLVDNTEAKDESYYAEKYAKDDEDIDDLENVDQIDEYEMEDAYYNEDGDSLYDDSENDELDDKEELEEASEELMDNPDFLERLESTYSKYDLYINNKLVDGEAKFKTIGECETLVDEKCFDSIMLDEAIANLKAVLEEKNKKEEKTGKEDKEK